MMNSQLLAIQHPRYPKTKYISKDVRAAVKIGYYAFFEKVPKGPDIRFCDLPANIKIQISGQFSMECMQDDDSNDYNYNGYGTFRPVGPKGPKGPKGPGSKVGNPTVQNRPPTKPPKPTEPVTLWHI